MTWIELGMIGIFTPCFIFILIVYRDYFRWRRQETGGDYLITIIDRKLHRLKVSPWMLRELLARGEVLLSMEKRWRFPLWFH